MSRRHRTVETKDRLDTRDFTLERRRKGDFETDRVAEESSSSVVPTPVYPRGSSQDRKTGREGSGEERKTERRMEGGKEGKTTREGGKVGKEKFSLGKTRTLTREEIIQRYCQDGEVPL